jgi:hypothetical protein
MNEKVDPTVVPERIWLLLFEGEGGSHVWCDQPDPSGTGETDAVEYVRADLVRQFLRFVSDHSNDPAAISEALRFMRDWRP